MKASVVTKRWKSCHMRDTTGLYRSSQQRIQRPQDGKTQDCDW